MNVHIYVCMQEECSLLALHSLEHVCIYAWCMYRKDVHNSAACNLVTNTFIMRLRTDYLLTLCAWIFCVLPVLCSPLWSGGSEGWLPFLLEGPLCGQDQGLEFAWSSKLIPFPQRLPLLMKFMDVVRKSPGLEEVGFATALEDKILFQIL